MSGLVKTLSCGVCNGTIQIDTSHLGLSGQISIDAGHEVVGRVIAQVQR